MSVRLLLALPMMAFPATWLMNQAVKPAAAETPAQRVARWRTALPVTAAAEQATSTGFGSQQYRTYKLKLEIRNAGAVPVTAGEDMFLIETTRATGVKPEELLVVESGSFNRPPQEDYAGAAEIRIGKTTVGDTTLDERAELDSFGVYNWQRDGGRYKRFGNVVMFTVPSGEEEDLSSFGAAGPGRTIKLNTEFTLMVTLAAKHLDNVHVVTPTLQVGGKAGPLNFRYLITLARSGAGGKESDTTSWKLAGAELVSMSGEGLRALLAPANPLWKRVFAAHWYGQYAAKDATPALLEIAKAKGVENDRLRAAAIAGLARANQAALAPALLPIASSAGDYTDVRMVAIHTLGELKNPVATEPLRSIANAKDPREARCAINALGRLGDKSAVPDLLALLEKGGDLAKPAGAALSKLADNSHLEALAALARKPAAGTAEAAIGAIGGVGTTEAVAVLADLSTKGPENSRKEALKALGRIDNPAALAALNSALADSQAAIRAQAIDAIAAMAMPERTGALLAALGSPHVNVREKAIKALAERKAAGAIPNIVAALKDENKEVRAEAAGALGEFADKSVVSALEGALSDKESAVRSRAASALGQIGHAGAIAPLRAALKDADDSVRREVVDALKAIKDPAAVDPLVDATRDSEANIRGSAAEALGKHKSARSVEALLALLKDETEFVRESASDALAGISGQKHGQDVVKWRQWWGLNKARFKP
jgi:HEAT repeat protein